MVSTVGGVVVALKRYKLAGRYVDGVLDDFTYKEDVSGCFVLHADLAALAKRLRAVRDAMVRTGVNGWPNALGDIIDELEGHDAKG